MTYEDILKSTHCLSVKGKGTSMLPLISNRLDTMYIEEVKREIQCLDIVLYKRNSGEYIAHRVIKKKKGLLITEGDNNCLKEVIKESSVLGLVAGCYRGARYIDFSSFKCRAYAQILCFSTLTKKIILRLLRIFSKFYKTELAANDPVFFGKKS